MRSGDDEKRLGFIDTFIAADWPRLRKNGRTAYIWYHHILTYGALGIVISFAWAVDRLQWSASDFLSLKGVSLLFLAASIAIISGYIRGGMEWAKFERIYLEKR